MIRGKRSSREQRVNKQNYPHQNQNSNPTDKKTMEKGAKDKLNELSDITYQFISFESKNINLANICPWNEDTDQNHKKRCSTRITRTKKSQDLQGCTQSRIHLKRKFSTAEVKTKLDKNWNKQVLTEGNNQYNSKGDDQPQKRISCILKSIQSRPSNLFPNVILKPSERSSQYTSWKNSRLSLPNQFLKTGKQSHIKVYASYDTSQTNFNKMILKCKQSTLYFKNPPKEVERQMVKYIGEHAVFVKCRERSRFRFQQINRQK